MRVGVDLVFNQLSNHSKWIKALDGGIASIFDPSFNDAWKHSPMNIYFLKFSFLLLRFV